MGGAAAGFGSVAGSIFSGVGTGMSAYGAYSQAQAQASAYEYNAALSERNAVLTERQAAAEEAKFRRNTYQVLSGMQATRGASGVTLEGSALDVLAASAAAAEFDALTIRYNGQVQAQSYRDSANLQRASASDARQAGYVSAATQLIQGLGGGVAQSIFGG